jgi:hypothetical protein
MARGPRSGLTARYRMRRAILLIVLAASLASVAPAAASASVGTFCVAPATSCAAAQTFSTIAAAMGAVEADTTDTSATIQIGAGAYNEDDDAYNGALPLTITGAGEGKTILNGLVTSASPRAVLILDSQTTGSPVTIQDLSVEPPSGVNTVTGIFSDSFSAVTARNIVVSVPSGSSNDDIGLELQGTDTVSHVTVDVTGADSTGEEGAGIVEDSSLTGGSAIAATGTSSNAAVIRSTLTGGASGPALYVAGSADVSVDDCVLIGVDNRAAVGDESTGAVTIQQSTLTGDGSGIGIEEIASGGRTVTSTLEDSIIDPRLTRSVVLDASGGGPVPTLTDVHDDFAGATSTLADQPSNGVATSSGGTFVPGVGNIAADPKFANPGVDLRLLPGSPAMNQVSGSLGVDDSLTDILGNPRIVDGAPRDMGAYQHQAPAVKASVSMVHGVAGMPVGFSAVGSSVNPGDSFTYAWKFDDGATATGASVRHAFAKPGIHHATVTATGAGVAGFSTSATVSVTVTGAPGKPSVSRGSLTGVAKGKPKLTFDLSAGKGAPALRSIAISLPKGLRLSAVPKGIAVTGSGGKRAKFSAKLSRGVLTVALRTPSAQVKVAISGGALAVTSGLSRKVRHAKTKKLDVIVKATDASGKTSRIVLVVKAR